MTPAPSFCSECGRPTPSEELARFGDRLVCGYCKDSYAQKLREGVPQARGMRYGGFWIRFAAYLIDTVILVMVQSIVDYAVFGTIGMRTITPIQPGDDPFAAMAPLMGKLVENLIVNTAISGAYFVLFVGGLGATPGKLACSLRVVRADGSRVGYGRAVARYFSMWLSTIILGIGYIIAGFDSEKRALHDMICDTRVIKTGN